MKLLKLITGIVSVLGGICLLIVVIQYLYQAISNNGIQLTSIMLYGVLLLIFLSGLSIIYTSVFYIKGKEIFNLKKYVYPLSIGGAFFMLLMALILMIIALQNDPFQTGFFIATLIFTLSCGSPLYVAIYSYRKNKKINRIELDQENKI